MVRAVAVAVLIAIILAAIGIGAAVISARRLDAETSRPVDLFRGIPPDAKLLELDKRALDDAYVQHGIRLWNVWLSDGARSADRITNGLRISRESYHQASEQIARRERELEQRR